MHFPLLPMKFPNVKEALDGGGGGGGGTCRMLTLGKGFKKKSSCKPVNLKKLPCPMSLNY